MAAPQKYPWDDWFKDLRNGYTLILRRVDHYDSREHSMGVLFRDAAKKRGMSVSIKIGDNSLEVTKRG